MAATCESDRDRGRRLAQWLSKVDWWTEPPGLLEHVWQELSRHTRERAVQAAEAEDKLKEWMDRNA